MDRPIETDVERGLLGWFADQGWVVAGVGYKGNWCLTAIGTNPNNLHANKFIDMVVRDGSVEIGGYVTYFDGERIELADPGCFERLGDALTRLQKQIWPLGVGVEPEDDCDCITLMGRWDTR